MGSFQGLPHPWAWPWVPCCLKGDHDSCPHALFGILQSLSLWKASHSGLLPFPRTTLQMVSHLKRWFSMCFDDPKDSDPNSLPQRSQTRNMVLFSAGKDFLQIAMVVKRGRSVQWGDGGGIYCEQLSSLLAAFSESLRLQWERTQKKKFGKRLTPPPTLTHSPKDPKLLLSSTLPFI